MAGGRPTDYTPEIGERVAEVFESAGYSLRVALMEYDDLPGISTVYRWEQRHPEFRERLSRARETRAHVLAEAALEVADDSERDSIPKLGEDGEVIDEKPNTEWIARSRLRYEARKWHSGNMNPGAYGDKRSINLGGQPGNPLRTESTVLEIVPDDYAPEERELVLRVAHKRLQGAS